MTGDVEPAPGSPPLPPRGLRIVVNSLFLLPSLVASWYFFVQPVWGLLSARQWQQIECEILMSQTRSTRSSAGKSTTPTIAITYRYEYAGRVHTSDDVDFFGGLAIRESVRADMLGRFPVDSFRPCHVDPDDAAVCVLDREFRVVYLLGLIPVLFSLMCWSGLRHALWPPVPAAPASSAPAIPIPTSGPFTLVSSSPPRKRLAIAAVAAGLFLALTAVFTGPASLIGFPLGIATVFVIGWVGYNLLALANPVPQLTVSATTVAPGDSLEVAWRLDGAVTRLSKLRICLECNEYTTVHHDDNERSTRVDRLASIPVHGDAVTATGSATVVIPLDALPTAADGRRIEWTLDVAGEIVRWPDMHASFPISVRAAAQS